MFGNRLRHKRDLVHNMKRSWSLGTRRKWSVMYESRTPSIDTGQGFVNASQTQTAAVVFFFYEKTVSNWEGRKVCETFIKLMHRLCILTNYRQRNPSFIKHTQSMWIRWKISLISIGRKACTKEKKCTDHKIHSTLVSSSAGISDMIDQLPRGEALVGCHSRSLSVKIKMFVLQLKSLSISTQQGWLHTYCTQWASYRGRGGSIVSTESMSSMMNDGCQVMCSIDIRLCSVVFVRTFLPSDKGLLVLRRWTEGYREIEGHRKQSRGYRIVWESRSRCRREVDFIKNEPTTEMYPCSRLILTLITSTTTTFIRNSCSCCSISYNWINFSNSNDLSDKIQRFFFLNDKTFFCLCDFPCRPDSVARTYKGSFPVQHPVKDPTVACRHQGCQAALKGDEEGEGVPHHLWLWPRNGCWDPEAGACVHVDESEGEAVDRTKSLTPGPVTKTKNRSSDHDTHNYV